MGLFSQFCATAPPAACKSVTHHFLIPRCSETVIVAVQIFVAFSLNFY